ncbi:uncharacterized protein BJ212DRAFT_1275182 [Suillus subaureus]|uniref:Protein-S-isoprenylcysteine O-methyltransferase n=1 Tax=Suillus subaureus TaxID=48587 RepID=A0A9P7JC30_9AGAM|nr:uncharacterized protein BJ212DRAFT_1275182 [Suillus subaureus]KAG1813694.1 hypothetical protein BJ212DRAFT_1275182 [Suillus subaureus]
MVPHPRSQIWTPVRNDTPRHCCFCRSRYHCLSRVRPHPSSQRDAKYSRPTSNNSRRTHYQFTIPFRHRIHGCRVITPPVVFPHSQSFFFTFHLSVRNEHTLVTTGPYSVVCHPSYLGALSQSIGNREVCLARIVVIIV